MKTNQRSTLLLLILALLGVYFCAGQGFLRPGEVVGARRMDAAPTALTGSIGRNVNTTAPAAPHTVTASTRITANRAYVLRRFYAAQTCRKVAKLKQLTAPGSPAARWLADNSNFSGTTSQASHEAQTTLEAIEGNLRFVAEHGHECADTEWSDDDEIGYESMALEAARMDDPVAAACWLDNHLKKSSAPTPDDPDFVRLVDWRIKAGDWHVVELLDSPRRLFRPKNFGRIANARLSDPAREYRFQKLESYRQATGTPISSPVASTTGSHPALAEDVMEAADQWAAVTYYSYFEGKDPSSGTYCDH